MSRRSHVFRPGSEENTLLSAEEDLLRLGSDPVFDPVVVLDLTSGDCVTSCRWSALSPDSLMTRRRTGETQGVHDDRVVSVKRLADVCFVIHVQLDPVTITD